MKVLHVIPSVAARYGGPSVAVEGYCRALLRRGIQTTIATTNADGDGVLPVPVGAAAKHEGIDTWFFERRGEAFKYSSGLARWMAKNAAAFDLVHVHAVFSHSSLAAGRLAAAAHVPYLVRPLGSLDPWSLSQQSWKKRLMLWSAVGSLVRRAAGIHFTTDEEARLAAPVTSGTPGRVVPLGVDEKVLSVGERPGRDRELEVVALSRLHPKKNLNILVRAFHAATIEPPLDNWRLTIAGNGEDDYRRYLKQLASAGPARDRIHIGDWITGEEKTALLGRAGLFAVVSHQENFGLALAEALAAGIPAIVSEGVNLAPMVATAGAGWVCAADESSVTAALKTAMADASERECRGGHARTLGRSYTWDAAARQLIDWYEEIATRRFAETRA